MEIESLVNTKQRLLIITFIILFSMSCLILLSRMLHSGLWYDESIEYFYSKFLNGAVPGGLGTTNMYERITSTLQPPLYNWIMYIWLSMFDNEFGFRLASILITILGGIGFAKALLVLVEPWWSIIGTIFYMFSYQIMYYALECSEYCLVLCMLSWTMYFFVRVLERTKTSNLLSFFIFACLSAYSQYGAVFLLVPMYLIIFISVIRKDRVKGRLFIFLSCLSACLAMSLILSYIIPQIHNNATEEVTHQIILAHGNIVEDLIESLKWTFVFNFALSERVSLVVLCVIVIGLFFLLLNRDTDTRSKCGIVYLTIMSWVLYYMAVACSFYAYNEWSGLLGTQNIGRRYGIILSSIWVYAIILVLQSFSKYNIKAKYLNMYRSIFFCFTAILTIFYCSNSLRTFYNMGVKDDIREVTNLWYVSDLNSSITLVHQWEDAGFQFYLRHDSRYEEGYQDNILTTGIWLRTAKTEEVNQKLVEMGIFDYNDFYYIGTKSFSEEFIINAIMDKGYKYNYLYNGISNLMHFYR